MTTMEIGKQSAGKPGSALLNTYATYPFTLSHGKGEHVYDTTGRRYIDFYGGHCVCTTGHGHPQVIAAIRQQLDNLMFYSNVAPLAIREQAAQRLLDYAGPGMAGVFFCNSGSEANENALKTAVQFTGRQRLTAFSGAFHGRTLLALSVSDTPRLKAACPDLVADVEFLSFNDPAALAAADFTETAAVIVEPVQSMAGIRVVDDAWLNELRSKCTAAGALLIFDEVQTGFARLGSPFAIQHFGVEPDLVTLAKGIASGIPMGAVLTADPVAAAIQTGDLGSTFGGGPVACAALLATLDVIEQEGLARHAADCHQLITRQVAGGPVNAVLGAGLLLGLDAGDDAALLHQHLMDCGLLTGKSNDPAILRLMPPLNISAAAIEALATAIASYPQAAANPPATAGCQSTEVTP